MSNHVDPSEIDVPVPARYISALQRPEISSPRNGDRYRNKDRKYRLSTAVSIQGSALDQAF